MRIRYARLIVAAGMLAFAGCSSSNKSVVRDGEARVLSSAERAARDGALQHFIDGSIFEMKGDHANAVLEYQDALRSEKNHAVYFGLSKCYSALNKHALAIDAGKEAVRLAPENVEYRRTLAEAYTAAFEIDAAAVEYGEVIKRDSNSIDSWYNLARIHQGRKPLKALEVYELITHRFGPEWDVLLRIAELNNGLGQFEKSAEALRRMLEIDPGNQELMHSIAQAYIRAEKFDTAIVIMNELRSLNPENLGYVGEIAGIYLKRKEYAKAARELEPVFARDSVSLDVKLGIGEMYFSQLEKDSTLAPVVQSVFERILAKHPDDWRPYWFLGAIGALSGNDSLSENNFRRVTELATWNADAWVYLSSVFMEKNNYSEVVKVLESALKVVPDDFRVNFLLGVAYSRLQRPTDAVRILEYARTLNATDVNCITQLALVYDGLKNYEETDKLYEEALKLDPDNNLVLNNYGYSLAERNIHIDRAFEMARKATEAQPENPSYLDTFGWVYFRMGRYEDAEKYIKQAIDKGGASPVLYEHLGDIYFMMKDRERALEQWNIALKLDANNPALRQKVERGTL